jgi:uncharacterized protein YbcI
MINQHSQNGTRGQLERTLSQQFQKLYKEQLGHSTGKVSCRLFDNKLMVIVEGSLTQPEQLLLENGSSQQVEVLHTDLAQVVRPQLVDLVENTLGLKVIDLLSDTTLETARTGLVVILSDRPKAVAAGSQ